MIVAFSRNSQYETKKSHHGKLCRCVCYIVVGVGGYQDKYYSQVQNINSIAGVMNIKCCLGYLLELLY